MRRQCKAPSSSIASAPDDRQMGAETLMWASDIRTPTVSGPSRRSTSRSSSATCRPSVRKITARTRAVLRSDEVAPWLTISRKFSRRRRPSGWPRLRLHRGPLWHPDGFYYFVDSRSNLHASRLAGARAPRANTGGQRHDFDLQGRLVICEAATAASRGVRTAGARCS